MERLKTWIRCALLLACAAPAAAQLAPSGSHYAGRPTDTGFGGNSLTTAGGFSAAVPIELPAARGGFEIPLHIVYGGRSAGAAGLGWDIPLSYIAHNRTLAYGRPASSADDLPAPRDRLTLSLSGASVELLPANSGWVARTGTLELFVRQSQDAWLAYDGKGRTYTFNCPTSLASAGLCLLKNISGPGGDDLEITYQIVTWPMNGGVGQAIDIIRMNYNKHASSPCTKHQIELKYGDASMQPISTSVVGSIVLIRKHTLSAMDVSARPDCLSPYQRLREYRFGYEPDADTVLPRLREVVMLGQQGTKEEAAELPVARYAYGSVTDAGVLRFKETQQIALPAGAQPGEIAATALDSSVNTPVAGSRYAMWQTLTDFNGDGRPDLLFQRNHKLWIAYNRPGPNGSSTLGTGAQALTPLADATFTQGGAASHSSAERRFDYLPANRNTTDVWRQAIDVNGDGRIDVVDAAEAEDQWVVYLNTPDAFGGVRWQRRAYSIATLRARLLEGGHRIVRAYLPLSRRSTAADVQGWDCWIWHGRWNWYEDGFSNHRCEGTAQQVVARGSEKTFTEWKLEDVNGDGYPDFLFNSSPADFQRQTPPDKFESPGGGPRSPEEGQVYPADFGVSGPLWHQFSPRASNEIRVAFNVVGVRFSEGRAAFSRSVTVDAPQPENGISRWDCRGASGVGSRCPDVSLQVESAGLEDINGDGLIDRVIGNQVYLGTWHGAGALISTVFFTLPGPLALQQNSHDFECRAGGSHQPIADQKQGMRDLTGDGIPDYVDNGSVWIGSGSSFRDPIPIADTGAGFRFTHEYESCDGKLSRTDSGLFDIDGDGRADVLTLSGNVLRVSQLVNGDGPGALNAGRLIEIDNGYGAKNRLSYASVKRFTDHPVPFPELVVGASATVGTQGLGGRLAGSLYAYGGATLNFDDVRDRFVFPGYQRTIELPMLGNAASGLGPKVVRQRGGNALIRDYWPLLPFSTALSKPERWSRRQRIGQLRDVFRLRSAVTSNPWTLLNVSTGDSRVIGATHYDWDAKLFEEVAEPTDSPVECVEMVAPLDFVQSFQANVGASGLNACRSHGFAFNSSSTSWIGSAPPPSTMNVQTRTHTLQVDSFGRSVLSAFDNDRYRDDDDLCLETNYAQPTGSFPRRLDARATQRLFDCKHLVIYASLSSRYDELPAGQVSLGRMSSMQVDQRTSDTGTVLNVIDVFNAKYDPWGNLSTLSTQRGSASRSLNFQYDEFGLTTMRTVAQATGTPDLVTEEEREPLSLRRTAVTDTNHTRGGVVYDGFGRPTRSTISTPDGLSGVISSQDYAGFAPLAATGRTVTLKQFNAPVPEDLVSATTGRTATIALDELGRPLRTELALGSDYADEKLVLAERTYDDAGRLVFQADPYPSDDTQPSHYGTNFYYSSTGENSCWIRGSRRQTFTPIIDFATERFPACVQRTFASHRVIADWQDAASFQTGMLQSGVARRTVSSAIGRPIERSSWRAGQRLELARFTFDHLGQLSSFTRYAKPGSQSIPVAWSFRRDSLGQLLETSEPNAATRAFEYSAWGEAVETRWMEGVTEHRLTREYDARARLTAIQELIDGSASPETVRRFDYDSPVGLAPIITPTYTTGRLVHASSASGESAFSYDTLGHINAQTFRSNQNDVYVLESRYRVDGLPAALQFRLPDTGYSPEVANYEYDSAGRLRTVDYSDADGSVALYHAETTDSLGRVLVSQYGEATRVRNQFSPQGRRSLRELDVESPAGARRVLNLTFDTQGRETSRREIKDGNATGPKTNVLYDALGRLSRTNQSVGQSLLADWEYQYDALGNVLRLVDHVGSAGAQLTYQAEDPDRVCQIAYGTDTISGGACTVEHDPVGNVTRQPTRDGFRALTYDGMGEVSGISNATDRASFHYDAFGAIQELDVAANDVTHVRHDRRYGPFIERREVFEGGSVSTLISRNIPGPGGILASRRGRGDQWVFPLGESRGNRWYMDRHGAFLQNVSYTPFGEATSAGVDENGAAFSREQWNGGDALEPFHLSQLGARMYDPVIGRFLSRDPLVLVRTATTSNPYTFAANDPLNASDPDGIDCVEQQCQPQAPLVPLPGFIASMVNSILGGGGSVAAGPPVSAGPKTFEGQTLKRVMVESEGISDSDTTDWDGLAAMKEPYEDMVNRLESAHGSWYPRHEGLNPVFNSIGSYWAGFGDFASYGAGHYVRNHVFGGFDSARDDTGEYYAGGIAAMAIPFSEIANALFRGSRVAAIATEASTEAAVAARVGGNAIARGDGALLTMSDEVVSNFAIRGSKALVGRTLVRRIMMIENLAGKSNFVGYLRGLLEAFETEARATGATELRIEGLSVTNPNWARMTTGWAQFGFKFESLGSSGFIVTKPL